MTAGNDGYIPVATLNQLQLISANLGANYRLANDIDATTTNDATASGIWAAADSCRSAWALHSAAISTVVFTRSAI